MRRSHVSETHRIMALTRLNTNAYGATVDLASNVTGTLANSNLAAGTVIQVVNAKYAVEASSASTSFSDTGLTASITPSSTSSKILIHVHQNAPKKAGNDDMDITLFRGVTSLSRITGFTMFTATTTQLYGQTTSTAYLDSPSSTSSLTYKTQFKRPDGSGTVYIQSPGESTMTLMEIAG